MVFGVLPRVYPGFWTTWLLVKTKKGNRFKNRGMESGVVEKCFGHRGVLCLRRPAAPDAEEGEQQGKERREVKERGEKKPEGAKLQDVEKGASHARRPPHPP